MSVNKNQLIKYVIVPTLKEIPKGYSKDAVKALLMIFAHESKGCKHIKQIGGGPALGVSQIEPDSHDDVWREGGSIWANALSMGIITESNYNRFKLERRNRNNKSTEEYNAIVRKLHPSANRLMYDTRYVVFMTRQKLFMDSGKLPSDLKEMSKYLKRVWNSNSGAADELSYYRDYMDW